MDARNIRQKDNQVAGVTGFGEDEHFYEEEEDNLQRANIPL
jgi:hypothetical protein